MATTKVTLGLPDAALTYLKSEAERRGVSMADVLRNAIEVDKIIRGSSLNGADVTITKPGEQAAKLLLP